MFSSLEFSLLFTGGLNIENLFSEKVEIDKDRIAIADLEKATEKLNSEPPEKNKLVGKKTSTKGHYKAYSIPVDPEDITGGYLIEYESYQVRYGMEASAYTTKKGVVLVSKSPEYISSAQMKYISSLMQSFENAIMAEDGKDTLDPKRVFDLFRMQQADPFKSQSAPC